MKRCGVSHFVFFAFDIFLAWLSVSFSVHMLASGDASVFLKFSDMQLLETFLRDNSRRFRRVVLVEYPREGLYSVGFVTGEAGPSLRSDLGDTLLSVFIPTAPNPTTGWYTLVPEGSVRELDISVEDAFRTIISAGIVNPDEREAPVNRSFSSLIAQLRASVAPSSS